MPASESPDGHRTYGSGIALLLGVVVLWTTSNFVTNAIETTGEYNKPFMVTWICTSSFAFYLLVPLCKALYRKIVHRQEFYLMSAPLLVSSDDQRQPLDNAHTSPLASLMSLKLDADKLDEGETFRLAAFFVIVWFAANYSINASLSLTSVSSATILATSSGFFTLLLGHMLGFGQFSMLKLFAVISSLAGVALICTKDHDINATSTSLRLLGDGLALLSALLYACYVSLLKVTVGDESKLNMTLFFGFVGALNILCLWPLGLFLHFTGIEELEWPNSQQIVLSLLFNGLITLTSDYIYLLAMLRTSPLVVTLGLSLTIPCAILGDLYKGTTLGPVRTTIGAALIIAGFIVVGLTDQDDGAERIALPDEENPEDAP